MPTVREVFASGFRACGVENPVTLLSDTMYDDVLDSQSTDFDEPCPADPVEALEWAKDRAFDTAEYLRDQGVDDNLLDDLEAYAIEAEVAVAGMRPGSNP